MRLLLISNSTSAGQDYLAWPMEFIADFIGLPDGPVLFIPYAGVTLTYDDYISRVRYRFKEKGIDIHSVHEYPDPRQAVEKAAIIVTGGGNTWQLLHLVNQNGILSLIRNKVLAGTPYIGWSAGANLACPTIRTTNDMPVVQPASFEALNLIPFQINPHYTDSNPEGHAGETREDRIREFIHLNRDLYVVGLREGTLLHLQDKTLSLKGTRKARIFRYNSTPAEFAPGDDLNFLIP